MADDEQFSLCWNNFNSNLSAGFHESLCRGDLVDVTLAAEGQFVKAHRLVLSVCSPYFRKMFTQMPANQHAFVFLKDVSHSALKDLIQFMYCGEVNVKQEALPAFISTAEALQIKGLTDSDPAPAQSPAKPSTPAPQPAPPAQTITQSITSPRVRQRNSTSRSYRIETDDSDDKNTTQIVLQATPVQQQQPQQQQQQQQQTQQPTIVQQTTTTTAIVSQKRTAPRSISTPHTKRIKNTIDPLEASEPTQITVQTVTESKSTSDAEFIDLPIEMPTKSEPDYAEEAGEVETTEQEATYVEDDSYGDMKYDESYFTEQEEAGAATGGSGGATTSTAVVKQSFVDNSYVEQADQSANEAQDNAIKSRGRPKIKNALAVNKNMRDRFKAALQLPPQSVVYASTTIGGMKVLYDGHYFKYVFKRYDCGVFQCCYKEYNDQCSVRIIVHRNLVYPLDGVHNHFNQATDKTVTSVLIEAGAAEVNAAEGCVQLQTISQSVNLAETNEFVVMEVKEPIALADSKVHTITLGNEESKSEDRPESSEENVVPKKNADDLREKIKKRLQQALMKKKK